MDVTTNNTKSKVNIRLLVGTGMLSGLAFVLQYLEFPIPIMPGFIKFDFSDLPALIGAFAYGPLAGVIVEFIKNLLHCTVTQSFTVGELSNFILGAVFTGNGRAYLQEEQDKKGCHHRCDSRLSGNGNHQLPVKPVYRVSSIRRSSRQWNAIIGCLQRASPISRQAVAGTFNIQCSVYHRKGTYINTYHSAYIQETVTGFKGQRIEKIPDTIYISHKHKERSQLRSFLFLKGML